MFKNINEFASSVAHIIKTQGKDFLPDNFEMDDVEVQEVTKGNDTKMVGILIRKKGSNIAPNVYLEDFYRRYLDGEDMDTLIDDICYVRIKNDTPDINTSDLTNLDKVKDKIFARIFNKELNSEYLKDKPYKTVEDLAVAYAVNVGDNGDGQMTMPINNGLLEQYGISIDELDKIAMDNLAKSNIVFKSMYDTLKEMIPEGMEEVLPPDDGTMYVLTNSSKMFGAAAILDKGTMDGIRKKLNSDFVVLPSSIHEVIILKVTPELMSVEEIKGMIGEINTSSLDPKEVLSDHPYLYTKRNGLEAL
jgi:hypothetical protein